MKKIFLIKTQIMFIVFLFVSNSVISISNVNLTNISKPVNLGYCFYIDSNNEKQLYTTSFDQDPIITEMIQKINESNIYNTVYTLQNFTTRYYGTSGNIAASTWLYNKLDNISGLTVEYQGGEEYRNVIATFPGQDTTSTSIYMVGAHYDSKNYDNPNYAPGATDNGGGVAIVLEFARIMSQYTFNHTLKFALWNAEEGGAVGSNVYVEYAIANNLNISLYINFDSSCYDPDNNFILDIMYNSQSQWIKDMMTQYNSLYNIGFTFTYNVHTCVSDHISFWNHGYTAVMTHSETHGPAHTQDDTVDKVNTLYAKKNGQLGMSVLAYLSEVQQNNPPNQPPNVPSNPFPPSGSINIDVNASLSWTCNDPDGDNLTYDVYFGTSSNPPLVSSGQSEDYYDPPGAMNYNTQYFWKIIAKDFFGLITAGPIWSFTTGYEQNNPPNTPINPSPKNGAIDEDINTLLYWSGGDPDGDDVVYDVYFEVDDNTPDVLVSNDQVNTFFNPGTLKFETSYYWQIRAMDEHGATNYGPVWHFTTIKESINNPPDAPIINGPKTGIPGISYLYSFITIDHDGDNVYYLIDWGDGTIDPWDGPHESNTKINRYHKWVNKGTYTILVKAKDSKGYISEPGTYEITMPRSKILNAPFLKLIENYPNLLPILQKILNKSLILFFFSLLKSYFLPLEIFK